MWVMAIISIIQMIMGMVKSNSDKHAANDLADKQMTVQHDLNSPVAYGAPGSQGEDRYTPASSTYVAPPSYASASNAVGNALV